MDPGSSRVDAVVVHGLRGRASNRRLSAETRQQAMVILRQPEWRDFGPTFAAQQLAKHHQIQVGKETLCGWMIEDGRWKPDARQNAAVHTWRPRRSGFGELVPWDTSTHDWLEGRGPVRYLVRLIDDATSWSWGRFVESDSTAFHMAVLWESLAQHGRMVDVYTDRASMFAAPPRPGEQRTLFVHRSVLRTRRGTRRRSGGSRPQRSQRRRQKHVDEWLF